MTLAIRPLIFISFEVILYFFLSPDYVVLLLSKHYLCGTTTQT